MRTLGFACVALAIVEATPAQACRADPEYDWSGFKNVALARVEKVELRPVQAGYLKSHQKFWWGADLTIERPLFGRMKPHTVHVDHSAGPGSCDFDEAPKVGDLRVVYFYYDYQRVSHDLDLTRAQYEDARVRKLFGSNVEGR
jgi:hypothetical protein